MGKFCQVCDAPLKPGAKFCTACGTIQQAEKAPPGSHPTSGYNQGPEPVQAGDALGQFEGSRSVEQGVKKDDGVNPVSPGLFRVLGAAVTDFLKDPKQLVPMVVLAVFWLILSLLAAWKINPLPVKILSFLTFAQGGMYAGVWGAIGGIIGKAVFAYFFSVLIVPLFLGKNPFKQIGSGFKGLIGGLAVQSGTAVGELLLGMGPALILFNFFTGNAGFINSMVGVAGFLLCLKVLWSKGGPVRSLVIVIAHKLSSGRIPNEITVNRVISGFAAGSALGVILTVIPLPYLPYLLGAVLLIAGIIFNIVLKPQKGVQAA